MTTKAFVLVRATASGVDHVAKDIGYMDGVERVVRVTGCPYDMVVPVTEADKAIVQGICNIRDVLSVQCCVVREDE